MAKKPLLSKLHKQVNPVLAFVLIGLVAIAFISALVLRSSQNTTPLQQYQTQHFPTVTPITEVNIFKISGSGKSGIVSEPPLYFEKTITDPTVVQQLYNAMIALPPFPTSLNGLPQSCGLGYDMHYNFSFSKDNKVIQRGTMTITSCGGGETISLDGSYEREFYDVNNWKPFRTLLLNSVGVSAHELYGATDAQKAPTVIFNQHTFASPDLEISFDYADTVNQPIHVQEVGNRVYLNARQDEPPLGKYVEVFSKTPSDSLEDAVKKQFLQEYSLDKCPVVPANLNRTYMNPAHEYVQITTPKMQENNIGKELAAVKLCPPIYTDSRAGIVYFMMDQSHPDKFVFFNLGQDNIFGKPTTSDVIVTWDQTLRFIHN